MICLIQRKGSTEFKGGNIDPEFLRICEINHIIMPPHCTNRRGQQAARTVGVRLAWSYNGLLADDTFPVQHLKFVKGIKDFPMAGSQLHHIFALVLYSNGVTKSKVHFVVLEECAFKSRID